MEIVTALRTLWRFRLVVAGILVLSIVAGISATHRIGFPPKLESRHYTVGMASATALVDTPNSQVADLGTANISTLSAKAALLASVMTNSPIKDQIAARAGVLTQELIIVSPSGTTSGGTTVTGATLSPTDRRAVVLSASIPTLQSGEVPILIVNTTAPDEALAENLANAAISVLEAHVEKVTMDDKVPDDRRLLIEQLGPARSATVGRGPDTMLAPIVAVAILLFGCAVILGLDALVAGWRLADQEERAPLVPAEAPGAVHSAGGDRVVEDGEWALIKDGEWALVPGVPPPSQQAPSRG